MTASPYAINLPDNKREFFSSASILIVEDSDSVRQLLVHLVSQMGFKEVFEAEHGEQALAMVRQHAPDVMVADIEMPVMNGLEMCARIRADEAGQNMPIVVMTALGSHDKRLQALRVGVSSILHKPVNAQEMANTLELLLQKKHILHMLNVRAHLSPNELEMVTQFWNMLTPKPEELLAYHENYGINIQSFYQPAADFGGDYWFLQPKDESKLFLFVADCSGHGLESAVYIFRLRNYLQACLAKDEQTSQILSELNQALYQYMPTDKFVSAVLLLIDLEENRITYSPAGHPPFFISLNGQTTTHDASGHLLGAFKEAHFESHHIDFPQGAHLCITSDAIYEPGADGEKLFDTPDISRMLEDAEDKGAKHVFSKLRNQIKATSHNFQDDLMLLMLSRER